MTPKRNTTSLPMRPGGSGKESSHIWRCSRVGLVRRLFKSRIQRERVDDPPCSSKRARNCTKPPRGDGAHWLSPRPGATRVSSKSCWKVEPTRTRKRTWALPLTKKIILANNCGNESRLTASERTGNALAGSRDESDRREYGCEDSFHTISHFLCSGSPVEDNRNKGYVSEAEAAAQDSVIVSQRQNCLWATVVC